ncbi:hypothetical protein SAMN05216203_1709 [Marinobacter daqiaonensis]|uniref:DUF3299 domain-containing protein n=1 Tax=Marinobacter daqiaonensis TaxID=650891 RepID=A0A1I6I0P4_9GAMM|nr:DUF3299 domain-containing protein [Marinobacter daqiaonensis]SFR60306.1 hypothetical protein SAMN05216203_1709 [Marinobacter daqiaonensis]
MASPCCFSLVHRLWPAIVLAALVLAPVAHGQQDWQELDWLELMPEEDLRLLESLPEVDHEGDGPVALPDEIMTGRVVPEMDGTPARIPGFVVPLKTVGDQRIVEFFLVPYYGACIHVPPPPPNQIIHVTYKPGFTLEALYDPIWTQGVIRTEKVENDIASSSYTMTAELIEPYEE